MLFCLGAVQRDARTMKPMIDSRGPGPSGTGNHSIAERSVRGEFGLVTKSEQAVSDPWLKQSREYLDRESAGESTLQLT